MIDLHCHLDLFPNPRQVVEACKARDLFVLSVTTTPSAWDGTEALAACVPRIKTALGLHPQLAHERKTELPLFDKLLPQTRYVGEIGLDGSPEFKPHWQEQLAVFDHVLHACSQARGRVLSIHSKRASSAVLDRLEAHKTAGNAILHWFSGSRRNLQRAVSLGCWFSVGPAMLRGDRGRTLAAHMPRDRILTESDGPFAQIDRMPILPWQVDEALRILAEIWSMPRREAEQVTHQNLQHLLALAPKSI